MKNLLASTDDDDINAADFDNSLLINADDTELLDLCQEDVYEMPSRHPNPYDRRQDPDAPKLDTPLYRMIENCVTEIVTNFMDTVKSCGIAEETNKTSVIIINTTGEPTSNKISVSADVYSEASGVWRMTCEGKLKNKEVIFDD
jgi:hypothetical protein